MRDVWSNDSDRTTRRGDTRTSEQVTADVLLRTVTDTMPCVWCPAYGWHDPIIH